MTKYNIHDVNQIKESLKNVTKRKIVNHLKSNSGMNLGSIIKDLKLNPKVGTKHIIELIHLGLIKKVKDTTLLELNHDLINLIETKD